jgi:Kef-type K+ transport system membrane component KefB
VDPDFTSLALIAVVAAASPLLADIPRRIRVPAVVFELVAGIVIGPQVLGLADVDVTIEFLGDLGLAFLFFLAGLELELERIRGAPLRLASTAWVGSVVLALAAAGILAVTGAISGPLYLAFALSTTALGTLLPILRDAGVLGTPFGTHVLAGGAVGEFGPIIAISLFLGVDRKLGSGAMLLLLAFVLVAFVTAAIALRARPPRFVRMIHETMHTSGQLAVRLSVALLIVLVWVASDLGLDIVLGAFTAGLVVGLVAEDDETGRHLRSKLDAIGFGVFVPVFFVVSGLTFDLDALLSSTGALIALPVLVVVLLLVRGGPAYLLYRGTLERDERTQYSLLMATALPLIIAITTIGLETGHMRPEGAAALVGAGLVTVLVFPLLALTLARRAA